VDAVLSSSLEAKKRPNGIVIIALLWVIISAFSINNGLETIGYATSEIPFLNDPSEPEWFRMAVPADIALSLLTVVVGIVALFVVYGLFTAKSWSYNLAFAIPVSAAIANGSKAALYSSAPADEGFAGDFALYLALTLINLVWIVVTLVYLRRLYVKQYLGISSAKLPSSGAPSQPQPVPFSLPYWETKEGNVIKAIVSHARPLSWKEIQEATGLDKVSLNKALSNLFFSKEIYKVGDTPNTLYKVSSELYKPYRAKLDSLWRLERKKELVEWITQWKDMRKLDFPLEHEHFFLEGRHLDDFSKELVSHAKSKVRVVNPFIQDCDLSNTLREARKRGVTVEIITRSPRDTHPDYRMRADRLRNKQEYLSKLQKEGLSLVYNEKVHAKLIVVDRVIAVVSSMNFYPESSAGASWEAGLVSLDERVVDSIAYVPPS
jgi:hypothetical protein